MKNHIQQISAVTFAVKDMQHSVEFYSSLGFELSYGGQQSQFSTLRAGDAIVNLVAVPYYAGKWWGRSIFRVQKVDEYHEELSVRGQMIWDRGRKKIR